MSLVSALLIFFIFVLVVWNISSSRRAKAQIRLRERKLQTILDNAPIVFSAIDANGIFTNSEGKGLEKLGRKNNESVGLSVYQIHHGNAVILASIERALKGELVETTFVLRGITFELFMVPEKNAGGVVTGVSMLSVDIDERKKIEAEKAQLQSREESALATSKLKSEFLANMSHEIRTPINGVLGMASLLFDTSLSSEQKEYTQGIQQSGSALLTIINDILDFSKIEAGKLDFEEIFFDIRDTLNHTLQNLKLTAAKKNIQITSEVRADFHSWYHGDPGRIRQVLNNLIGNALKFTNAGCVLVRVSTIEQGKEMSTLKFEVEDTGIGIPAEALNRLFVAFSQADASMARRFGGTGLGLSICKQLVERMGGEIGVTSQVDQGSTFWFTLKLQNGEAPRRTNDCLKLAHAPSHFPSDRVPRILVAEDNLVNQVITVKMLEKMGCQAQVAENGIQAVEACNQTFFDLILMDCQMPEMDGLEATRTIRVSAPPFNQGVPILAMTANAMKGDEEKCLAAGMDGYISKPVTKEKLAEKVTQWLKAGEQRRLPNRKSA